MDQNPSSELSAERKRWSSLPDDIISNILSRLDLPQNLVITISDTTFNITQSNKVKNIPEIIPILDNIFTVFTTPLLKTVSLHLHRDSYTYRSLDRAIDSWARRLRCSNVEHFKSTSNSRHYHKGGQVDAPSVFQIQSLVSLDLDLSTGGFAWTFPDSINLPNLKKLSSIFFNDDVKCIEKLLSSSPSLEDLTFTLIKESGCPKPSADGSLTIVGTNLTRLSITLHGFYGFEDFTRLNLHFDTPKLEHFNFTAPRLALSYNQIIRQFIDSISHVNSLVFDIAYNMMMPSSNPNIKTIFPNVTHLTWTLGRFERLETLPLLLPCPKLEVLVLKCVNSDNDVGVIPDAKTTLYEHMKRIELNMTRVRFDEEILKLTKYFLRSASCLEKLVLNASFTCTYDNCHLAEAARFHRSLLDCPRRSSFCEIEFLGVYHSLIYPPNFDSD
ncbi:F-box/FBD/LRR-repeat protein At5g53840-like [Silene latifolia]|uniref:F-box/FBD/LRR-repeat protein At5g53840-like n=1 Tax=Silene latifolia TaxID=37657 RepID=UPI003D788ACF